ncbi:hypothetical protein [Calycomorphotria hydatis]|uniref:Uncharacterized protein n=1 Tax=Calycomorphotria hydatis TaxID=2528027 RepID=A0A517T4V4_9PLAN|nr:hypothetical protein [Calycomorphotria hydatis]QDT63394.1 hypothetical protein V22_06150 [Calycomorphotria hydatis]
MSNDELFSPEPEPRNSGGGGGKGCMIVSIILGVLVLGGVAVVACCGGLVFFGINTIGEELVVEIEDDPAILEHIGDVEEVSFHWNDSINNEAPTFTLKGSKGDGKIVLAGEDMQNPDGITLVLDSGDEFELDLYGDLMEDVESGSALGTEEPAPADAQSETE